MTSSHFILRSLQQNLFAGLFLPRQLTARDKGVFFPRKFFLMLGKSDVHPCSPALNTVPRQLVTSPCVRISPIPEDGSKRPPRYLKISELAYKHSGSLEYDSLIHYVCSRSPTNFYHYILKLFIHSF